MFIKLSTYDDERHALTLMGYFDRYACTCTLRRVMVDVVLLLLFFFIFWEAA
jgi:hypothetical protein